MFRTSFLLVLIGISFACSSSSIAQTNPDSVTAQIRKIQDQLIKLEQSVEAISSKETKVNDSFVRTFDISSLIFTGAMAVAGLLVTVLLAIGVAQFLGIRSFRKEIESELDAIKENFSKELQQIKENFSTFGWDLDLREREGKLIFLDATPVRVFRRVYKNEESRLSGLDFLRVPELTLNSLIKTINKIIEEEDIQRIAVDPITPIMLRYEKPSKERRAKLLFFDALVESGCTSFVTTELRTSMLDRGFQIEEFLSQGVILLHTITHEGSIIRAIQIEKMRGIEHDAQLRPYQITNKGIEVYPRDRVF